MDDVCDGASIEKEGGKKETRKETRKRKKRGRTVRMPAATNLLTKKTAVWPR